MVAGLGATVATVATVGAVAFACAGAAFAGDAASRPPAAPSLPAMLASGRVAVETVFFGDGRRASIRVVRGVSLPIPATNRQPSPVQRTEILSFGTGFADRVTVVRGRPAIPVHLASFERRVEKVSFGDPLLPAVTIVRGLASRAEQFSADLFGPANGGELDRIAFAVDGIESRHGADLRMWRPEPNGPQGPMQISAAAALDVGGGDRFDLRENRLLGRAYLAQMFRRYGNWPDALAAYNWGPGNMDQWIARGRSADRLPPGVAYYVSRALHDAFITATAGL